MIIIWSEDLNFHIIEQEEQRADYGCRNKYKIVNNESADEREQLKWIMTLCETFNLLQVNHKPTREKCN